MTFMIFLLIMNCFDVTMQCIFVTKSSFTCLAYKWFWFFMNPYFVISKFSCLIKCFLTLVTFKNFSHQYVFFGDISNGLTFWNFFGKFGIHKAFHLYVFSHEILVSLTVRSISYTFRKYSKTPQMAPSKLADPADWRLVLGHPIPAKWRPFPAEWRIDLWEIEIFIKYRNFRQIGVFVHKLKSNPK